MITVLIIVWATPKKVDTELRTRNLPVVSSQKFGKILGHADLFFKVRKALPHFIERRISLKIHLRTAQEEISSGNSHLSRLC